MKDSMNIEGKEYISSRRAAEITKYSNDYIGQLCRSGKISARMIGRTWFVAIDSIIEHKRLAELSRQANGERQSNAPVVIAPKMPLEEAIAPVRYVHAFSQPVSSHSTAPKKTAEEATERPSDVSMHAEPLKYESDSRPLMPEIKKTRTDYSTSPHTLVVGQKPIEKVIFTAEKPARSSPFRFAKAGAFAAFILVGAISFYAFTSSTPSSSDSRAQTASVSDAFGAIGNFFYNGYEGVLALFGQKEQTVATAPAVPAYAPEPAATTTYNGMAIVSSTGSDSADEAMKQRIADSFSDQVEVHPDKTGTAGVVTPVFRSSKGSDFVYVLVPVSNAKTP